MAWVRAPGVFRVSGAVQRDRHGSEPVGLRVAGEPPHVLQEPLRVQGLRLLRLLSSVARPFLTAAADSERGCWGVDRGQHGTASRDGSALRWPVRGAAKSSMHEPSRTSQRARWWMRVTACTLVDACHGVHARGCVSRRACSWMRAPARQGRRVRALLWACSEWHVVFVGGGGGGGGVGGRRGRTQC